MKFDEFRKKYGKVAIERCSDNPSYVIHAMYKAYIAGIFDIIDTLDLPAISIPCEPIYIDQMEAKKWINPQEYAKDY